jgi:NMD protein affecting ribosome stability and mRNA decay
MERHCPLCNKSSNEIRFIGEICQDCYIARLKKTLPMVVDVEKCGRCSRVRMSTGYFEQSAATLADIIARKLKAPPNGVRLETMGADGLSSVSVSLNTGEDKRINFTMPMRIRFVRGVCPQCRKATGGYYEATVQLRGDKVQVDHMLNKLTKFVKAGGAFVAKVIEYDYGCDVQISDKKLTGKFFAIYGLNPTKSFGLYGTRNGRKLYRNIYMLRL